MSPREVVVITGASAGVGRAVVRRFARPGVRLALLARGREGLEGARREASEAGAQALVIPVDVANGKDVEAAAETIEKELGPIDIWINNAMVSVFSPFKDMEAEEFERVTMVTYLGVVNGTRAALKRMLPRDSGVIVQVGSALAYRSIPLQSAYCGAKHAVRGFTDSLRSELIHDKSRVRLTMVQLPALNTPQFDWLKSRMPRRSQPIPPIYQPELAAEAIHWAARHRRREVALGFSTVRAILGNKLIPGLLDRYLARIGYDAQQTDAPRGPVEPVNLWEPVRRDHGAHGSFDSRARSRSVQLMLSKHRGMSAVTAALGALGIYRLLR